MRERIKRGAKFLPDPQERMTGLADVTKTSIPRFKEERRSVVEGMTTRDAGNIGQQLCSWKYMGEEEGGKQKTHLKSVYMCIQKWNTTPTDPCSFRIEDVVPKEWFVDKDLMATSEAEEVWESEEEEEEEEEGGGGEVKEATVAAPRVRTVEGTLTPATAKMPLDVVWGSIFVALGTRIYCLGGVSPGGLFDRQTAFKHVYVCDVARPEEGWVGGPELINGRFRGTAAAVDGKIYLFGGGTDAYFTWFKLPFIEILDPESGEWRSQSPPPPPAVFKFDFNKEGDPFVPPVAYGACPLPDVGRILIQSSGRLLSYDVENSTLSSLDDRFGHGAGTDAVFLDGVLFLYRNLAGVYGYDVANRKWFSTPVTGLRRGTDIPYDDEYKTFLLYLGGGRLCILWCGCLLKNWKKLVIHSTVFRVRKKTLPECGEPLFQASIEASKTYCMEADLLWQCLAL